MVGLAAGAMPAKPKGHGEASGPMFNDAAQVWISDNIQLEEGDRRLPKPTIGLVNGAVYGGGVGLVACCDIAFAAQDATFSLSEVKLGLIPATIAPYVHLGALQHVTVLFWINALFPVT